MTLNDEHQPYGRVAKIFHWGSAVFILPAMLIGMWWIWTDLDTDYGWEQFESLITWHANFGLTVIVLMLPRLVWRAMNKPASAAENTAMLRKLAGVAHFALYGLALFTPISGWLGSALDGTTFHYFWILAIPPVLGTHPDLAVLMTAAHTYASWALIALIALHLAAVLYHQLWLKDRLLKRML